METFSIIIPAYNCVSTLQKSVNSVLHQLHDGDEVIIVDDCSTDGTYELATRIAATKPQVKLFQMEHNSGCLAARGKGVLMSSGSRILFLDADDTFYGFALYTLRKEIGEKPCEILHFGLDMMVHNEESSYLDEKAGRWFAPFQGVLAGDDVFSKCFVEHKYNWNLVNKCFDADLCRKACCFLPDYRIQRGEDAFLYFVIAYFAKSYRGLKKERLYRYEFGAGQDSFQLINLEQFEQFCDSADAADAIAAFLKGEQPKKIHLDGRDDTRRRLAVGCASKLRDQLPCSLFIDGISIFVNRWGFPDTFDALSEAFSGHEKELADSLQLQNQNPLKPGDTLASFYWSFSGGGAENVQKMLVSVWQNLGLNVVLLMEEEPDEKAIDELGVDYKVIPKGSSGSYVERYLALEQIVSEYNVKGIVYHQWVSKMLLWDMLAFRHLGAAFFIHCHGIFTHCVANGDTYFNAMPHVYHHADGIVSLSEVDASYWRRFNSRTFVTVNPSTIPTIEDADASRVDESRILWLGRISSEKRPIDALDIFAEVVRRIPNAKLDFVGSAVDQRYEAKVKEHARRIGIDKSVNFAGWSNEQARYYKRARVFLMTSDPKEGYPLTLGESRAVGVPCVMYDLPYLTLVREGAGIETVPFGDRKEAAEAIIRILENDDLYESMRSEALETARRLEDFDFTGLWRTVLMTQDTSSSVHDDASQDIAWKTLSLSYEIGLSTLANKQKKDLDNQKQRAKNDFDKQKREFKAELTAVKKKSNEYKQSNSWRIGRIVTSCPRFVKRTVKKFRGK